ncbi:hypothetical protein JOB18_026620 [Solea senegalensis]|uniref:Uncharacterized protein n=1 Tax=Solea senegalensis TaxID=28829 RepID=A0AAV6SM15_SOLSE|nr:microtubule-associated tumor suppressor 1 homolog A isoform X1 [Solea senegalensis]XP_043895406.1 microtubule-associated tumor suppressor 1 homolog A isoform X1 [Solea senegalensis]KAG7518149.1 hypothetical protein JOB18_026620 [Solea senegalensis]
MSNKTFTMSTDQVRNTVPAPHRGLQLGLSPESYDSNSSMSPSPDSNSSICSPSDSEANGSPDINMLECCLNDSPFVDKPNISPQGNVLCSLNSNLNETYIATSVNGSLNVWNKNLSLLSSQETGSEKYHTFSENMGDCNNTPVTSPHSAGRESHLSSCKTSCRESTEHDCCSLSSGEMVMRRNSFCLDDQSLLVVSSLDESSISPAASHQALPAESKLLSTTLPDVCETSPERVMKENVGLGMTFIQGDNCELPAEENDTATCNYLAALPSENEGGLFMTFVCETSSTDSGHFINTGAELLAPFSLAVTPEQGNPFVSTLSAMQEMGKHIHTSTPVQTIDNKIPSLPSFSESPCTGTVSSPGLHPVKQQPDSVSPEHPLVTVLPCSATKVKSMEIKKFPKSNFSNVKSRVLTRAINHITVPGPALQHKPSRIQVNLTNEHTDALRATAIRISPAKVKSNNAIVSPALKLVSDTQKRVNTGAANLCVKMVPSHGHTAVNGQVKGKAFPLDHQTAANKNASALQTSNTSPEMKQASSSQVPDNPAHDAGNQTVCLSTLKKSLEKINPKPAPKKGILNKIGVRSGSALSQDKALVHKTRPRCSSESSSSTRPPKEKKTTWWFSKSFSIPKVDSHLGHTKTKGNQTCSSQNKHNAQADTSKEPVDNAARAVKKISLLVESRSSTATGDPQEDSKSRFYIRPSPRQTRGAPPAISQSAATLSTRPRQFTLGRNESRSSKAIATPQSKQKGITGSQKRDPSLESIKPKPNGSQPPKTPTRPSLMGPPPTPASRPRRSLEPSRNVPEASVHSELSEGTGCTKAAFDGKDGKLWRISGGTPYKQTQLKSVLLKARLLSAPGRSTEKSLTTGCKSAAPTSKRATNSSSTPLKRSASARLLRPTSGGLVDKTKSKGTSHQQQPSQPNQTHGPPDVVPPSVTKGEKKDQSIQQLMRLLTASNCRFEALTIVLQQTLIERDEATRQCRELSQELVSLRGDLVSYINSSERLEKEKELRVSLEASLQKLQEQHQKDVSELEQRLQAFYQAEWDKVHLTYQEEADKCNTLMQQQMGELRANHEALKLELQSSHEEQLQCVKQQYEESLEELTKVHHQELQSLDKMLKDAESSLLGQIQELTIENNALIEKLTAEERRRKELADKSQKDSHSLYLEQELDSLKVVLDIKNKQLHQQEKKLMEIEKLMEKNVKLDENLKKVQQENEDLKARMERHAAMSRQLSTEQAMLQESLQKESKVNKRLSMENEELLWKLHNGDLSSPRKVSPTSTSPSHSFNFQSPRSSGLFSSPPLSPR